MNMTTLRKGFAVAVATVLAASMSFMVVPKNKAYAANITPTAGSISAQVLSRVPAVESAVGRTIAANGTVPVKGLAGKQSALVRVSVFGAAQDTVVNVTGTPALSVTSGHDASATVLAPVSNGTIAVAADHDATIRVEVLATFADTENAPGMTKALATPTTRAAVALAETAAPVAINGLGGVPSDDVRAAYVTADITLPAAGNVTLGGQQLSLPAGRSLVSTIVVPDAQTGAVNVTSSVGGSATLTVRGWVSGSAAQTEHANVKGSFVPATNAAWQKISATDTANGSVNLPGSADKQFTVALVSASQDTSLADGTQRERTFVDVGESIQGRSHGVVVDASNGALPQLEVVENPQGAATVAARGEAITGHVLALGDVLGDAVQGGTADVTIEASNANNGAVDLAQEGNVELTGTVTSDAAVDSVKVYGNGTLIGTAAVQYDATGKATWNLNVAAPNSGDVDYKAVAETRGDAKDDASVKVNVTLPDADDTVLASETKVLDEAALAANPVLALTDNTVTFANEPTFAIGDIIVAGVTDNAPEGFLRGVKAIEHTDAGWVVTTELGSLTEAILQTDTAQDKAVIDNDTQVETPAGDDGPVQATITDAQVPETQAQTYRMSRVSSSGSEELESSAGVSVSCSWTFAKTENSNPNADDTVTNGCMGDDDDEESNGNNNSGNDTDTDGSSLSAGVKLALEASAKFGLRFKLKVTCDWSWFLPDPELQEFKAAVFGELDAKPSVDLFASYESKPFKKELAKISPAPVTFTVGPVPVVIKPSIPLNLEITITAEGKVSYAVEIKRGFEVGPAYSKDRGWYLISDPSEDVDFKNPCNVSASVEAASPVKLSLEPEIKLYDTAGPKVEMSAEYKPSIKVTVEKDDNDRQTASLVVDQSTKVKAAASVVLKLPVIDKKLAELEVASWEKTFDLEKINIQLHDFGACSTDPEPGNGGNGSGSGGSEGGLELRTVQGKVTSAVTGLPISGAYVKLVNTENSQQTFGQYSGFDGSYSLGMVPDGKYQLTAVKFGYTDYESEITVDGNEAANINMIPPTSSTTEYKAVLSWGEKPRDEDSHLVGSDGTSAPYHVYYGNKDAYDANGNRIAWLDHDDTTSYGPETLTFDVNSNGTYNYYVHNYSGEAPLNTSGAKVELWKGNTLIKTYTIPADWSDQNIWGVFSIVHGQVVDFQGTDVPSQADARSVTPANPLDGIEQSLANLPKKQ